MSFDDVNSTWRNFRIFHVLIFFLGSSGLGLSKLSQKAGFGPSSGPTFPAQRRFCSATDMVESLVSCKK